MSKPSSKRESDTCVADELAGVKRAKTAHLFSKNSDGKKDAADTPTFAAHRSPASHHALSLAYLQQWHDDRSNWKFQKLRQMELMDNMFNKEKLPKKEFGIFCDYIKDLKGGARERAIASCKRIMHEYEDWRIQQAQVESADQEGNGEGESEQRSEEEKKEEEEKKAEDKKRRKRIYQRAKKILEVLA